MSRIQIALAVLVVGAVAALAAVAGAATSGTPARAAARSAGATVATRHTKLGTILVDGRGRTLYLFEKDRGARSTCSGSCASAWPPLITKGAPRAGHGAKKSLLRTFKRADGRTQVAYHGHPLYYFVGDHRAGDTAGQGLDQFGAEWYVLSPKGSKVDKE